MVECSRLSLFLAVIVGPERIVGGTFRPLASNFDARAADIDYQDFLTAFVSELFIFSTEPLARIVAASLLYWFARMRKPISATQAHSMLGQKTKLRQEGHR